MSDNEDKDLTRIEDLAEFLHDEDDSALFDEEESSEEMGEPPSIPSLEDLEDSEDETPPVPDFTEEASSEESFESPEFEASEFEAQTEENSFGNTDFGGEFETSESDSEGFSDDFQMESEPSEETQDDQGIDFGGETEEATEEEEPEVSFGGDDDQADEFETTEEEIEEPQESHVFTPASVEAYSPELETRAPSKPQQNFEDLKQFAESISYGAVAQGGNPPFSLILRGIHYQEDANDIMIILREHGLVSDENEQSLEQGLANGSLLISQISEYSAIYLAHRFRRFDLDVMVGLADEVHPSQSYDADARGLVSKQNIKQNINESFDLERAPIKIQDIILTTTPTLEDYNIREYLGVVSHHAILSAEEIEEFSPLKEQTGDEVIDALQRDLQSVIEQHGSSGEDIQPFGQGLETLYNDMAQSLRASALKIGANAIVGINYQLTPVIKQDNNQSTVQYKVTCLGSAVWAVGN